MTCVKRNIFLNWITLMYFLKKYFFFHLVFCRNHQFRNVLNIWPEFKSKSIFFQSYSDLKWTDVKKFYFFPNLNDIWLIASTNGKSNYKMWEKFRNFLGRKFFFSWSRTNVQWGEMAMRFWGMKNYRAGQS